MKHTAKIQTVLVAAVFVLTLSSAQAQPGRGGNSGRCHLLPNISTAAPTQALSATEVEALNRAIQDEYKARATYNRVLSTFGDVRPFSNIVRAEGYHVQALAQLFERYGIAVPADTWADQIPAYASLLEAAEASVEAEVDNGALYDELLAGVSNTEVRAVFDALRAATLEHHLPAFQRFVARQNGQFNGRGQGMGRGMGMGQGRGRGMGRGQGMGRGRGNGQSGANCYNQGAAL